MENPKVVFLVSAGESAAQLNSWHKTHQTGWDVRIVSRGARPAAMPGGADVVCIAEYEEGNSSWRDDVNDVRRSSPSVPILLLAVNGSEQLVVEAFRLGLADYVAAPWPSEALMDAIQRCLRNKRTHRSAPRPAASAPLSTDRIIGSHSTVGKLKSHMADAAAADCTVLITGETGTGKELAAEFIHESSPRRNKPFICINCAAIPDALLESELFGYSKGAFTGADGLHDGLLRAAEGGTVFLDEIGDMSLFAQAKILRVLESKEVCRLGGTQRLQLNVRFIAATNQELETMTHRGSFRKDLYFRLDVARVQLPALRERRHDIPLLAEHYSRENSRRRGAPAPAFSEECWKCLLQYDWPGNVRELKNVIDSLFLGQVPESFCLEHLPARIRALVGTAGNLSSSERDLLLTVLSSEQWNKSKAAAKLRWSRMTLYRKMAKYQISRVGSEATTRKPSTAGPA